MDDPAKGAAWLIAAAARLRQEGLPVRLTLTRPPRPESPDWLRETGWIDQPALLRELAAADVAVMPSLWDEAFGLAALEAMAAGLPLIASSAPGPRSFIRHGEDAWLVPPGDEQALLDALRLLHDAPELRRRLGVQARRRAAEFTWDAAAAALGRELRSLLGS
jgi:glycosyltransferase involved in cell wall biosynthesis